MSLINDALRRASQSDKNRPKGPATPIGMEVAPTASGSKLTLILAVIVVIAVTVAGLLFWQLWKIHNAPSPVIKEASAAPVAPVRTAPPPITPKPAPVVAPAPAPTPKPAPVPVAVAPPPVVAAPVATTPLPPTAPVVAQVAVNNNQSAWPTGLKLSAIFFSRTNPRVLISGTIYGVGDQIEGATIKTIGKDKVILQMNGETRELLEGQ